MKFNKVTTQTATAITSRVNGTNGSSMIVNAVTRPGPANRHPFLEMLQQEIERVIDGFRLHTMTQFTPLRVGLAGQIVPAIDRSETDDVIEITAELPGVASDDLDITIDCDVLTLKGEKADKRDEKDKNYQLVERSYGHFQRRVPLGFAPEHADTLMHPAVSLARRDSARSIDRSARI